MKFLHVSDLHLGRTLGEFDMAEDQNYILNQIIDIALEAGADALLVSGDVYDKSVPGESAVALFDAFLRRLAEANLKTFIISGNHDSDERMNFGSGLFRAKNIYISAKFTGVPEKFTLSDNHGDVNIFLLPFVRASLVRRFYPDEEIPDYDSAVRAVLANSGANPNERNVLLAHQFVVNGSAAPVLGGSESLATRAVGTVEMVHSDAFEAFDYVALGHIHSAQRVGREGIRYSGSPLKYSQSEAADEKCAILCDLGKKGELSVTQIPLKPKRNLRIIKGRLSELLSPQNIVSPEDFIFATLTDEEIIDNAMSIMQQYYPNAVRIEYQNSRTAGDYSIGGAAAEKRPFGEIIADFYRQVYGGEISPEEMKLMKEAAKEAGITDEAD